MTVASMARMDEEQAKKLLANILKYEGVPEEFYPSKQNIVKRTISTAQNPEEEKMKIRPYYNTEQPDTTTKGVDIDLSLGKTAISGNIEQAKTKREDDYSKFLNAKAAVNQKNILGSGLDLGMNYSTRQAEGGGSSPWGDYTWDAPHQQRFGIEGSYPITENFLANFRASHGDAGLGGNYMEGMNPYKDENEFLINFLLRR